MLTCWFVDLYNFAQDLRETGKGKKDVMCEIKQGAQEKRGRENSQTPKESIAKSGRKHRAEAE